jgi:hypothetical protein
MDSGCEPDMENIFKVLDVKIKYETVQFIYQEREKKQSYLFSTMITENNRQNYFLELIKDLSPDSEKQKGAISKEEKTGELVSMKIERMSEEEIDKLIEQMNCTPEQAFKEYMDYILNIKSKKEIYLKCIDAEFAKGDSSEYAKENISPYSFLPPMQSVMHLPVSITKLDFLKVFKEFVFNDNEDVLPGGLRVYAYLKCNCKIP